MAFLNGLMDVGRLSMFQAIVHAPALRPGARLCLSDLAQTPSTPPAHLAAGDDVALRFGACCPDHGNGAIESLEADSATLRVAAARWRLHRCPTSGGIDVPGLVAEDWFVVERAG